MDSGALAALSVPYRRAEDVLSGGWRRLVRESGVPVCFFEASPETPAEERGVVAAYALAQREHPTLPVFVSALVEDAMQVNRIISGHPCLLSVEDSGTASSFDARGVRGMRWQLGLSLSSLLRTLAPGVSPAT